jgi:hypothetical protein
MTIGSAAGVEGQAGKSYRGVINEGSLLIIFRGLEGRFSFIKF